MLDREKCTKVLTYAMGHMEREVEKHLNAGDRLIKWGCHFEVYGTENVAYFTIEPALERKHALKLGVLRRGTDRLTSHYLCMDTAAVVLAALRDMENVDKWMESLQELSDSVDEYW